MSKTIFWLLAIGLFFVGILFLNLIYHVVGYPWGVHLLFSMVFGFFYGWFATKFYYDVVE